MQLNRKGFAIISLTIFISTLVFLTSLLLGAQTLIFEIERRNHLIRAMLKDEGKSLERSLNSLLALNRRVLALRKKIQKSKHTLTHTETEKRLLIEQQALLLKQIKWLRWDHHMKFQKSVPLTSSTFMGIWGVQIFSQSFVTDLRGLSPDTEFGLPIYSYENSSAIKYPRIVQHQIIASLDLRLILEKPLQIARHWVTPASLINERNQWKVLFHEAQIRGKSLSKSSLFSH